MGKFTVRNPTGPAWDEVIPGSVHVRDAGSWKEVKSIFVRQAGAWQPVWERFIGTIRPDGDQSTVGWTTTPLWSDLDESSPDDSTTEVLHRFTSDVQEVSEFEVTLSNPATTPTARETVTLRTRFWLELINNGVTEKDVKIELKEGAVVRKTINAVASTIGYVTNISALSQAEKDSITDWDNLRVNVEFTVTGDDPIAVSDAFVTWIELEFS